MFKEILANNLTYLNIYWDVLNPNKFRYQYTVGAALSESDMALQGANAFHIGVDRVRTGCVDIGNPKYKEIPNKLNLFKESPDKYVCFVITDYHHNFYDIFLSSPRLNELSIWDDETRRWIVIENMDEVYFLKAKEAKKEEIANDRWIFETSGITLPNGIKIDTSRQSQSLITGAVIQAQDDESYVCKWKTADGNDFVELDQQTIFLIAKMIRYHVQSAFDKEGELLILINNATTLDELNSIRFTNP